MGMGSTGVFGLDPATGAEFKLAAAADQAANTVRLLSSAASVNATNVKSSAGTIKQISGYNARASAVFLKLYDKASAPTVGTDTPRKTIYLPPATAFVFDMNDSYALGIGFGLTTAVADNSTAAVAAGDITALNLDYL